MIKNIVGKNLAYLSFINQNEDSITIGSYSGKKIILWWFPKADTPGWTIEGNGFRDRIQEFISRDTLIFGVSGDTSADNRYFKEKFHFPFDILSDHELKESKKLKLCGSTDLYAPRVSLILDAESNVIKYFDTVDPKTHAEEVLAFIDN